MLLSSRGGLAYHILHVPHQLTLHPSQHVTWRDPYGTEPQGWQGDLLLSGMFLAAAGLVLGFIDPVYLGYEAQPFLSLFIAAGLSCVLLWGAFRSILPAYLVGAGGLFGLIALCLATQPVQLGLPLASVLPMRAVLLLLVLAIWP